MRNMDKQVLKKLAANPNNPLRTELTVVFQVPKYDENGRVWQASTGTLPSLGVELVSKRSGGVFIKSMRRDGLASASGAFVVVLVHYQDHRITVDG